MLKKSHKTKILPLKRFRLCHKIQDEYQIFVRVNALACEILLQSYFFRWLQYLPLEIQETPFQQQFVWQTTLGHIFPALKHFPVQDDTYHGFHGFSSNNPASHHMPSTP